MNYVAPWWLPGGQLQTIWPPLYSRRVFGPHPHYQRERWIAPDADFIDVDWLETPTGPVLTPEAPGGEQPLLVLFHGLEGTSRSQYAEAFADYARTHGMHYAVAHFRGCSGELNWGPRAYHSGDYEEIDWILRRMRSRFRGPIVVVGISMGGNALLRWAQEMGASAAAVVQAIAAVCSPVDLVAGGGSLGSGFNRMVYTPMFLKTMKPKALKKLAQHPGLFDAQALSEARDLYEFDNLFTAPLHGYASTEDYWARASAKPLLHTVALPALVLNARNDPFVPDWSLPRQNEVGRYVTLWQPPHGGHVGFPAGRLPGHVRSMPDAVGNWLRQQAGLPERAHG